MTDQPVRYGIVGLGRSGWDIHVAGLRGRSDARIVAVVDPLEQRRQEAKTEFGCKTYSKLGALLKQDDVEVVVVATPSMMHGPDTRKALKAGKHVVVEKPMAMSLAEADRMIQTAQDCGKLLFVHQNYRFHRSFTYLQEVVRSGILGRIYHIRNYQASFQRRRDWQTLAKNGGGVLNNTCPHMIDQILQLTGSPVKQVMGDLQQVISAGDVEDHVKAFMRCENGCTVDMEVTTAQFIQPSLPNWIIAGQYGTLVVTGKNASIHWLDPNQLPKIEAVDGPVMSRAYGSGEQLPWQERNEPAEGPDVGHFYDNVYQVLRKGGQMRVTPESVREVMRVISLIRKGTPFTGKVAK